MRTRLSPALARPFTSFNTHIRHLHSSLSEYEFRPRQLAYVFQYTDFFIYNRCRAILTYDNQFCYRLTDDNFF